MYEIVPNNTLNAKENTFFHKSFRGGFGIAMRLKKRNKQRDGHISYFSSGPMTSFSNQKDLQNSSSSVLIKVQYLVSFQRL